MQDTIDTSKKNYFILIKMLYFYTRKVLNYTPILVFVFMMVHINTVKWVLLA